MIKILDKETIKSSVFIHYGNLGFDLSLVKKLSFFENHYNKPKRGGLWFSPMRGFGWKDWCKEVEYRGFRDDYIWKMILDPEAKIIDIENPWDIEMLPSKDLIYFNRSNVCSYINFKELISQGYHGILVKVSAIDQDLGIPFSLGPTFRYWDCDSLLMFGIDGIKQIISYESNIKNLEMEENKR